MRSLRVGAASLVLAVALTGCTVPQLSADPEPSATPEVTLVPEQQRETGLTRPQTVFEGECDAVFTTAELVSVLGEEAPLGSNHFDELWAGDYLFDQNGGFECTWRGSARVIALLLPEAAVEYEPSDRVCAEEAHDTGLMTCPVEAVANGIRLSGLVSLGLDEIATAAARDELVAIFEKKAAQQPPVSLPLPALGAWRMPSDCEAVAAGADLSAVPGLGASTVGGQGGYGKDTTQAENALKGEWTALNCYLQGSSAQVAFIPAGGSRWREQDIAGRSDAVPLVLDGVESAYSTPYRDGMSVVYAFSGPNMLIFTVRYTTNAAGIATALFASLDATAVT